MQAAAAETKTVANTIKNVSKQMIADVKDKAIKECDKSSKGVFSKDEHKSLNSLVPKFSLDDLRVMHKLGEGKSSSYLGFWWLTVSIV